MISLIMPISAILLSTFFMLIGVGLGGVLIPLRASLEGWSATDIAWIGTSYALAFTSACILVPKLVRRVGHIRVYATMQALLVIAFLLHALVVSPLAWILIRGLGGFALAGGYMVLESWLNEKASNEDRGSTFSAYMIVSMGALALGQYMLPLGDPAHHQLFLVVAIVFALALLPTALSTASAPAPVTEASLDLGSLFKRSPAAVVGCFMTGIVAGNWQFFAPVYGGAIGLPLTGVATMVATALVGGVVFQYPLGALSDRIDRRYVMVLAGLVGGAISLLMIAFEPTTPWLLYLGMFVFGSVLYPIYALNVAHANDTAEASEFVKVSSGLLIIYGFGNMAGPQLGGRLMEIFGPKGFFLAMALSYAAYGSYALWRTFRRDAPAPEDRDDFQVLPVAITHTPETAQLDPRSEESPAEDKELSPALQK
jgi:MFS family permease